MGHRYAGAHRSRERLPQLADREHRTGSNSLITVERGSKMLVSQRYATQLLEAYRTRRPIAPISEREPNLTLCLLYTSDAADE